MKTPQPIKRSESLAEFSREHHFGLLLIWKIRLGLKNKIEPKRIGNYILYFFEKDLKAHFLDEENNLFSKLSPDDALCIQAYTEHKNIYDLMISIKQNPTEISLLKSFGDALEGHIRFEERVLFNYLQDKIAPADLIKMTEEHHENEKDIDSEWPDHFWVLKS